jgi:ferric-dicitrate binding protein FerR (iron transport regulator)
MKVTDVTGKLDAIGEPRDAMVGIDADDIVRLARGEHLGARHDAALEALAASPAARDAYRIARAVEPEARELALRIAAVRGANVVAIRREAPVQRRPMRWAAAAAVGFVAVGVALFGGQGTIHAPQAPVASAEPATRSDLIFRSSDEGLASAGQKKAGSDDLFVDAFGG